MPEEPLRLFVALPAPARVRRHAAELRARMQPLPGVRWVRDDLLHLTLRFLGGTPPERLQELQEILGQISNKCSMMNLHTDAPGAFPRPDRARVIWLGLRPDEETAALTELAEAVEEGVRGLGFPAEERPFAAHMTLGRARRAVDARAALLRAMPERSADWQARQLVLMHSVLHPHGPEYTKVAAWPLGERSTESGRGRDRRERDAPWTS